MARGGSTDPGASLELFLDTISNVLGGVLFVAMIVVLLLQVTSPQSPASDPRHDGQPDSQAIAERLAALEAAAAETPREHADALAALARQQREMRDTIDALTRGLSDAAAREAAADDAVRRLRAAIAQARADAQAAVQALAAARARRDGVIRLPRFQTTSKQEVPVLIAAGRAIAMFTYDAQGRPTAVNTRGVERLDGGRRVRPKPGQGAPITAQNAAGIVRTLTADLSPDTHYVTLGVWNDSFDHAAHLRNALTAAGYDYGLLLLPPDGTIPLAAQSGTQ